MRLESPTRHVLSPVYIHPMYHVAYNIITFSNRYLYVYILFYQMHRNVMHMERIEVGVHTIISPFNFSTRIIYGALAQFCVHTERSY